MPVVLDVAAVAAEVVDVTWLVEVSMAVSFRAYWPICRVLSSSVLAVFITSTLFW